MASDDVDSKTCHQRNLKKKISSSDTKYLIISLQYFTYKVDITWQTTWVDGWTYCTFKTLIISYQMLALLSSLLIPSSGTYLTISCTHNILWMSVSNAQNKCGHTIARTGSGEGFYSLVIPTNMRMCCNQWQEHLCSSNAWGLEIMNFLYM